jgi:hypothetical protein
MQTSELKWFVEDFIEKFHRLELFKLEADIIKYNGLFSGFLSLESAINRYEKELATDYNIFYILNNIYDKEVITHSPFMADLLNINGSHMQGDLFYRQFLSQLKLGDKEQNFIPNDKALFFIELEKSIGYIDNSTNEGGRIDILITYRDGYKQFAIAIENKINALDQQNQLLRYYHYLQLVHQPNFILVYLTKRTKDIKNQFSPDIYAEQKATIESKVINLCYKNNISQLIEQSLINVNADNIRAILKQYLQIIKNF